MLQVPEPRRYSQPYSSLATTRHSLSCTRLELGVGAVGVPPDELLAVMADLGHLLHDLLVYLYPEAVPGRTLPVPGVEVEHLWVLDVAEELVAEEGDALLLDQDVWCREVDLERRRERHRAK